ncbi:hypothetical protein evm_013178 [Chilo suppressalis]|nr:hypothetical protein evm_013178 [Chilo suppressalis]
MSPLLGHRSSQWIKLGEWTMTHHAGPGGLSKSNIKLITVVHCKQPKYKYDPQSPMLTGISIKKMSRGVSKLNITYNVTETFGPIELHARSYQVQENAVRNLMQKIEHMDCKSALAMKIVSLANLQFEKNCNLKMVLLRIGVFSCKRSYILYHGHM